MSVPRTRRPRCQNCLSIGIDCNVSSSACTGPSDSTSTSRSRTTSIPQREDSRSATCDRCGRLGLPCRWPPKRPGRPPGRSKVVPGSNHTHSRRRDAVSGPRNTTTIEDGSASGSTDVTKDGQGIVRNSYSASTEALAAASSSRVNPANSELLPSQPRLSNGTLFNNAVLDEGGAFDLQRDMDVDGDGRSGGNDIIAYGNLGRGTTTSTTTNYRSTTDSLNSKDIVDSNPTHSKTTRTSEPPMARIPAGIDVADLLEPSIPGNHQTGQTYRHPQTSSQAQSFLQARKSFSSISGNGEMRTDDPVGLGILSWAEAADLFAIFYQRLNPLIALLDADLHTLASVQQQSAPLTTAILYASSRFWSPSKAAPCFQHLQTLIARSIIEGAFDIKLVQAIMISTFWRDPGDRSAWVKTGLAIRIAQQLHLHLSLGERGAADELEARLLLDRQRTWICLVCYDRQFSWLFELPVAIEDDHAAIAREWLEVLPEYHTPEDTHLACTLSLAQAANLLAISTHYQNGASDIVDAASAISLRSAERHVLSHRHAWFSQPSRLTVTSQLDIRLVSEFVHVYIKARQSQQNYTSDIAWSEFIMAVSRMVEAMTEAADAGLIWLWFDANIATFPPIGLRLYKYATEFGGQEDLVIQLLGQIHHNCRNVEGLGGSPSCTLVGKFFGRLVEAMRSRTQAEGRIETDTGLNGPPFDWTLTQFFEAYSWNDADLDRLVNDDEFWSSLGS